MLLTREKMRLLLTALSKTRDDEVDCDHCAEFMAEFAEVKLAGVSVSDALQAIEQHLDLCGDCSEEFELLKESILSVSDTA